VLKNTESRDLIRVAHVVLQLQMGGMEKLLVEFARHADRDRFALHFVSLGDRGVLADELEAQGWPVTTLEEPPGFRPGLVLRLARFFHCQRIDVVHTHNTKPLLYAGPAARLAGVRRLLHTRHGQRFQASRRHTALFQLTAQLADRVICVSRDSARLSVKEGIAPKRVCAIWNGIDVARFHYTGPAKEGPAVMVGRLSPEKDVDNLLKATALVVRVEPEFRLEVAGDGPCLPALRKTAGDLGLGNHVRFLGQVRDIPALLARASLFVLPSLTEGISLTLLEAMARGLPVVTTRVGGNSEVVAEGETGLLVPAQNPDELARAILEVWRDPVAGHRLGLAGRSRVEQCFDVRHMVAAYETHYAADKLRPRDRWLMGKARENNGDPALRSINEVP
jgi:glycosyltransferase involved in cell wall biosynthesis